MTQTALQRRSQTSTDLALTPDRNSIARVSMRELRDLAEIFIASGQFTDIKSVAQAQLKILAGNELGFSPIVSMTGIHFFQGRVSIGANLIASLIKDSGKYEYKILQHSAEACEVAFFQNINGELKSLGTPVFYTYADAQQAGLTGKDVWKKYPKDMLFAACIRQGARRYCADILRGVTPESDDDITRQTDAAAMDDIVTPATAPTHDEVIDAIPVNDPPDYVDQSIHETPTDEPIEALRANVLAALDELPKSRRNDLIAGLPLVKDMTEDELNALLAKATEQV